MHRGRDDGIDGAAADNRILLRLQRLWEKLTVRFAGDYQTRRLLPLVRHAGLIVQETVRTRAATVERVHARKAGDDA